MSHEIRTPLNSIIGFASLLPEENSKDQISIYSSIIERSSEQLLSIIDDVVYFSKLQSGILTLKSTEFKVYDLLVDVLSSFNLPIYSKHIKLYIDEQTNKDCVLLTDYEKIRQIIINLVSNSYKYTNSGYIKIGCLESKNGIELFVEDSGIGIPLEEHDKIFERFYRGSNLDLGKVHGTGLGLSIVKQLIQMLENVSINVESELNKGTTFYIKFAQ